MADVVQIKWLICGADKVEMSNKLDHPTVMGGYAMMECRWWGT